MWDWEKNRLKTLKCINRTTTLAKKKITKKKKIYSIYNYIQKHNSKERNMRQMHPRNVAASFLFILIFKNTSQMMRAKIPTEQKTNVLEVSTFLFLFPSFLSLLIPKHVTCYLNLLCYKWSGSTERGLSWMGTLKHLPGWLLLSVVWSFDIKSAFRILGWVNLKLVNGGVWVRFWLAYWRA